MEAEEILKQKKGAYSDLAKRLKNNEALSTRAMKKLSEKQKLIQEQSRVIVEKEKESKEDMEAVKKRVNKSMILISRTEQLMQPHFPLAFSPSLHETAISPQTFQQPFLFIL